jgi:hypothetical protein
VKTTIAATLELPGAEAVELIDYFRQRHNESL